MRIVKEAEERKNEILDVAEVLFAEKGYDNTSISDIINKVGVARGTVYYHFKSKEDVLNALIDRTGVRFLTAAQKIADDKSIPVLQRLFMTLMSISSDSNADKKLNKHIHNPQNALMHQKTHKIMLQGIPPILTKIVEDGIKENIFETPYPYESVELTIAYTITVFDDTFMLELTPQEQQKKIEAFIFNLERLFGTKPGSFAQILQLFN